jgi:hypothetical protein
MPSKKHLVLTYGVTEGRQRTVMLPLKRVNAALIVIATMAVWSFGTLIYFVAAGFRTEAVVVATPFESLPPVDPEELVEAPAEVKVPEAVAVAEPVETAQPAPVQVEPTPAATLEPELAATVENYRATEENGKLVTKFSIRNLSRGTLRGKVIGEAEFVLADGSTRAVTAEQDYKAKTLSTKELAFSAPGDGKFTKVRLTIQDKETQRAVVFFK